MSVTYTDQVRPAAARPAARVDSEAYVPVYARSGARKSNKPVKTWMILAPLGVLAVGGAAAAMLMQPAGPAEEAAPFAPLAAPFAPLAAQLAASETAPLPSMPMQTPAELTTAAPIPPSAAAPVERRAAQAAPARAAPRAAAAPEAVEAPVAPTGPQPYLSVAPRTVAPQTVAPMIEAPAAPVTSSAAPAPIVITPTT
ncbi:hypothetical protein [Brevundimonas bullata]|uniref:hypothetical protein n=1 Tax=Brevundimonas bullata TaxID=13160 RepID=UPI002FD9C0D8